MSLTGWYQRRLPLQAWRDRGEPTETSVTPFKYTPRPIKVNIQGVLNAVRAGHRGRGFTRAPEEPLHNPVFTRDDLRHFNSKRYSQAKADCKVCGKLEHLAGNGLCALCDNLFQTTFPNLLGYQEKEDNG